jgi:membrane protease YdiL (CAAX protease family)
VTRGLLVAVLLWPAGWYGLARRLRRRWGLSRARQLAAVVGYDVLTWTWAILLLAVLPPMTAADAGVPAGAEIAAAALAGAALYAALARGRLGGVLRGLRPDRRVVTQGAVFALTATAEEVIFRGFLLAALVLELDLPVVGALLVATVAFALMHVDAHGRRGALTHLLTGLVFGAVFVTTASVAAAAACHVTYNLGVLGARRAPRAGAPPRFVAAAP